MSTAAQILSFMKIVEKLCSVKRDNLLFTGEQESDSDHVFKLCFLIMMIHPYLKTKADLLKLLEMALVHDIVEATSGDYPLSLQQKNPELKKEKKQKELEAIESYKSILPAPLNNKIYDLFIEYEDRQTFESKLVYALDKLEATLQMSAHKDGDLAYVEELENGNWYFDYAIEKRKFVEELGEDIMFELEDAIINLTKTNIEKCGIKGAAE